MTEEQVRPGRVQVDCSEGGKTVKSEAEACDINLMMKRYQRTGQIKPNSRQAYYGDFTVSQDYGDAMHAVNEANEQFMELPAAIRSQFKNDPQELLAFLDDPENAIEAIEMGLLHDPDAKDKIEEPEVPAEESVGETTPE